MAVAMLVTSVSSVKAEDIIALARQEQPLPATTAANWALRLPQENAVEYRGIVSFDNAGQGQGAMMYPGGLGLAGFLVSIAAHAAIVEGTKSNQKTKIQEKADEVLSPYRSVLENYTYQELMQSGLAKTTVPGNKKLIPFAEKPTTEQTVESNPVFFLAQDQSAIVLENVISIPNPNDQSKPLYQNTVKVISPPRSGEENTKFWTDNQGQNLKEESARLFARSFDIALNDMRRNSVDNKPQKTYRYLEGSVEKMERGELVSESCNRIVIRNLRGWLMSIPVKRNLDTSSSGDQCSDALNIQ